MPRTTTVSRPRRLFYGWWVLLSGFVAMTLNAGFSFQGFGAFVVPLQQEFGWSKAAISAARALTQIESGLLGPVEGWSVDKFGSRLNAVIGVFLLGLGLVLFSRVDSLGFFYFAFAVMAIGSTLAGILAFSVALNNWFQRKRTLVFSLFETSIGFSGIVIVPLLVLGLTTIGWRSTVLISGVCVWAIGIPLALIIRNSPEKYGLLPDGDSPGEVAGLSHVASGSFVSNSLVDFTLAEAIRTRAFWFVSLGHGMSVMVIGAASVHQFAHMEEGVGLSPGAAALVVSVVSVTNIVGRILGGYLGDNFFDKRYLAAAGMIGASVGLVVLTLATSLWQALIFGVLFGFGWGIRGPLIRSIQAEYFGRTHFGKVIGVSSLLTTPASIVGPVFAGAMADTFGNYQLGFIILAILGALGTTFFILAKRPSPPSSKVIASSLS